jgi:putative acetyltransferase
MIIRPERKEEFTEIYELVKIAFQTAQVSDGKEQDFVNQLRASDSYIPELALVSEEEGKLTGHIMLNRAHVVKGDQKAEILYLAPVSVVLEKRNQGVGSALIKRSFELAREMGYKAVVLVGNPAYYQRFGFKTLNSFGIKHKMDIPDELTMVCELYPGALQGIEGTLDCF